MSNSLIRIINNLIRINRRQIDQITIHIIMVRIDIYEITNTIRVMESRISRSLRLLRTLRILLLNSQQIFFKSKTDRNHRSSGN